MNLYNTKLLILGAGIYQVPLIKKARELGCFTVVASIEGDYPGFDIADKCYFVSTQDEKEILKIAKNENIDGICTTGTDVAVKALGLVCKKLGLNGISYKSANSATDKILMKNLFQEYGVRTADFRVVSTLDEALEAFNVMKKPLMLKSPDSSGSRGIVKVERFQEISEAYDFVTDSSDAESIIAEEFISGKEFGAQCIVHNGNLEFLMPHGDLLYSDKTNVPVGHYVPLQLDKAPKIDLSAQVEKVVEALELNDCAINFDFILKDEEVYVIEAGARAGATCLPELVTIHYGIDYYKLIIELALGIYESMTFLPIQACGSLILFGEHEGLFSKLELPDEKNIDITEFKLDVKEDDQINKFSVGPDRIGHIIIKGESGIDVLKKLNYLQESYTLKYAE